jgi:hypothetical protein
MALCLVRQLAMRDLPHAIVQEGEYRLHRIRIAFVRAAEKPRDVSGLVHAVSAAAGVRALRSSLTR